MQQYARTFLAPGFWLWLRRLTALLMVFAGCGSIAQAESGSSPSAADAAQVRVGARSLFVLHGAVGSFTAEDRAREVNQRLEQILRDPRLDPNRIEARTLPDGTPGIVLDDLLLLEVTEADAQATPLSVEPLSEQWATQLRGTLVQVKPLYQRQSQRVSVQTLSEHHVLLLIVQVAILLLAARLCGELMLRLGQPPVIGQLLAGILLGQSFLGAWWPDLRGLVFPVEATHSYLLEVVSWLGVLFLLLLTGLETDVALIRQQGRPALFTSITGVVVPFALGAGVGLALPNSLLTTPETRLVLTLFLGTVLSVSSVPVIANILFDMRLLRRNVGQLILAAALAHDTIGWIVLAVVASLASSGTVELGVVLKTLLGTAAFILFSATLGRVLVRRVLRWVNDTLRMEYALLTATVVLMLLGAATTQFIGVHAVLGAFVMGILLRQAPVINQRVLHPIESVTAAIFAPIFFAAAGLHVNLGVLTDPRLLGVALLVIAAASAGKVLGGYIGARWGGSSKWDAWSVGIGTNARGAMGLIVGILGFSLGILTVDMFSIIIVMAVVTTAVTPPLLRWSLQHVKPAAEEEERLRREELQQRSFIGQIQRVLLPSRGGEDARLAARLVNAVAAQQAVEVTGMYIQSSSGDKGATAAMASVKNALDASKASMEETVAPPGPPVETILKEAARGYDLLAVGCGPVSAHGGQVFGRIVDDLAARAALSLLVVRAPRRERHYDIRHLLVPTTGIAQSIHAAEFAIAVARTYGARVTALHVYDTPDESMFWLGDYEARSRETGQDVIEQVRSLGEAYGVRVDGLLVPGNRAGPEIVRIARERDVDLIVMGGGMRKATRRLFFGTAISTVLQGADAAVAVLSPSVTSGQE